MGLMHNPPPAWLLAEAYPSWLMEAADPAQEMRRRARERARRTMKPPALVALPAPAPQEPVEAVDAAEDPDQRPCVLCGRGAVVSAAPPAPKPAGKPTFAMVVSAVARFYQTSLLDIESARRTKEIMRPRHIAMYLGRELTLRSSPEIGRQMGGRDHTTVLHGWRKIKALRAVDAALGAEIEAIIAGLPKADVAPEAMSELAETEAA